jgi:hypothetical protein
MKLHQVEIYDAKSKFVKIYQILASDNFDAIKLVTDYGHYEPVDFYLPEKPMHGYILAFQIEDGNE